MSEPSRGPAQNAPGTIPEVEAEFVDIDDQTGQATKTALGKGARPERRGKAPRVTPGLVLFVLFVALAIGLLAMWLAEPAPTSRDRLTPPAATGSAAATPARDSQLLPDVVSVAPAPQHDPGKIANDRTQSRADALAALPTPEQSGRDLPQSGPVFDNENLQRSAKEALRLATPAETADRRSERASDEPAPESRLDDLSEYEARTQIQARDTAAVHLDSAASADVTAARVFEQSDMARITAELAELKSAHERSQSEIAVLNAQLADALLQRDDRTLSELSELRAEVATLLARQHEATRTPLRDPASLMALQRAVDAGRPYAEELNRLPERTASRAFIEVLRAWSQTGVATRAALYGQFEQVARDALAIAANEHASGPLSGLQARIRGVFSLRPAYPKAGDAPDAIIARAEIRMRDEGIESALVELDSLQGRAREAFAAWTKEALARIAVDEAMNALEGEYSASYTN